MSEVDVNREVSRLVWYGLQKGLLAPAEEA